MADYFFHLQFPGDLSVSYRTSIYQTNSLWVIHVIAFLCVLDILRVCDNICCNSDWLSSLLSVRSPTRLTMLRFVFGALCHIIICAAPHGVLRLRCALLFEEAIEFVVYIFPLFKYTFVHKEGESESFGRIDCLVMKRGIFFLGESFHTVIFTFLQTSCLWMSHCDFIWKNILSHCTPAQLRLC